MRPRSLSTVVLMVVAATVLTACEKPAPSVSVWTGTTTTRESALCWAFDADDELDAESCLAGEAENAGQVEVRAGQRIGISVDAAVAEDGWFPAINDTRLTTEPIEETFFGFELAEQDLAQGELTLRIAALNDRGEGRGIWSFALVRG